jgi:hypothetical protein
MDVVLLLADSAQVSPDGGKVHALGLGWDATTTPTPPATLVVLMKVMWHETNERHHFLLQLRDADGHAVQINSPMGEQAIQVEGDFEVGRAPGIPPGTMQTVKLAAGVGPMALQPGRYEWHAVIDGETKEDWSVSFTVRSPQPAS